jgi:hypothetical protein
VAKYLVNSAGLSFLDVRRSREQCDCPVHRAGVQMQVP